MTNRSLSTSRSRGGTRHRRGFVIAMVAVAALGLIGLALADSPSSTPQGVTEIAPHGGGPKAHALDPQVVTEPSAPADGQQTNSASHASAPAAKQPSSPKSPVLSASSPAAGKIKPMTAPSNDNCTGAIPIPAGPYPLVTAPVDVTDATPQGTDEGLLTCATTDATVWWSFTPAVTGNYIFSTCQGGGATGSTVYDTVLAVFASTGGACPQSTQLACNDTGAGCTSSGPSPGGYWDQSTLSTVLTAGQTYFVVAGHWSQDVGGIQPGFNQIAVKVDLAPGPPNDTCAAATPLQLERVTQGTTAGASNDYQIANPDATCFAGAGQTFSNAPGRDAVFSFTAPADGKYSIRYVQDDSAAALRSQNPVLYASSTCPAPGSNVNCLLGANRMLPTTGQNRSEEIYCLPMTASQTVYVFFDDATAGNDGGPLQIEVHKCNPEVEPNDTIVTATPYACNAEGGNSPYTDVDFWSLGTPPAGSKVFAALDAVATNENAFRMRITSTTDTLGYDAYPYGDGTSQIGSNSPVVAGPVTTGTETFVRVSRYSAVASEPYRLYAIVRPPIAQAQVEDDTGNGNGGFYQANLVTAGGYVRGEHTAATDFDCFRFVAKEGDDIAMFTDNNPDRVDGPIDNAWPLLYDLYRAGSPIATRFTGQIVRNILTPSPNTLTGTTPTVTSEFWDYRARYTGTHWVCYYPDSGANGPSTFPVQYAGSISLNCNPIPAPSSRVTDVSVTKTGPASPVATSSVVDYTITVTNNGSDIAQDVRLYDVLPPNTNFVALFVNDGFSTLNIGCGSLPTAGTRNAPVDCLNYSMAPGTTTTWVLRVQVNGCIGTGVNITNTATISSASTDPNPDNNSATWSFTTTDDGTCSDLDACTTGDHCEGTVCVPTGPTNCDDHSVCTDDSCDPAVGCINDPSPGQGCNDGFPCTLDLCDPVQGCVFPPAPAGTACNDFINCTNPDACDGAGTCTGPAVNCDDNNPCTADSCDEATGACVHTPVAAGVACSDGNACTSGDACDGAGACVPGTPVVCDDNNSCTTDSCNPTSGCVFAPTPGAACSDDNACTSGDTCNAAGQCVGTTVNCNDGNACTADSCDPATGCVNTPTPGASCSDGNACTTGDTCNAAGQCVGGAPLNCNDGNACTADSCDPAIGCVNAPTPGASCSDGNACTTGDTCSAAGQCVGGPPPNCDDNNPCTADSCDPATGCVNAPTPGASCSDGNACTVGDSCNAAGQCVSGAPVVCVALDQCHDAGVCDPFSGACSNPAKPDGTVCNDNNLCTTGDHCEAGSCTYTFNGLNEPNPRTKGWYKGLCQNPHSGDMLTDADAVCVGQITSTFAGISTVAQICDVLMPSHPNNDACGKDEDELMTLALNICRARVCTAQDIDSKCTDNTSVGQSFSQSDVIFSDPSRGDPTCDSGACMDREVNNGSAIEMNSLTLALENGSVRLTWEPPYLNDGGGHPKSYNVYRRVAGSLAPFTLIGNTAQTTYLDTTGGETAWEYEVTEVMN